MKPSIVVQAVCGCLLLALRGAAEGLGHQSSLRSQLLHPRRPGRPRSLLNAAHRVTTTRSVTNVSAIEAAPEDEALRALQGQLAVETGAEDEEDQKELKRIHEIEQTLISLKADKAAGRLTPGMESFVTMVKGIIKDDMIPKIEAGHKSAAEMLASVHSSFAACGAHRSLARVAIATLGTTRTSARSQHQTCRRQESQAFAARQQCWKVVTEKRRLRDIACKALKDTLRNPDDDADNCHTLPRAERYGLWLKRNRKWFEAKHALIQKNKAMCEQAKLQYEVVQGPCNGKKILWQRRKAVCNKRQRRLEMASCTLSKKTLEMCSGYTDCYGKQKQLYESQVPLIKTQEKDRKVEWRALKRIECLLTEVFGGDSADPKAIDACTSKVYDTSYLSLKYPRKPAKDKSACVPVPPVPGTRSFVFNEYRGLPKGTKPLPGKECVLAPGAGVQLYVAKQADKARCKVSGEWLSASNGGSCLLAGRGGYPLVVDYTKKRFTKYRFTMRMAESDTRNKIQEGGGFAVCNLIGTSSAQSNSPAIVFKDAAPSQWGYRLSNFRPPQRDSKLRDSKAAKCEDMLVKYQVWGKDAVGLDVAKYTGRSMKWIGCNGDGCETSSFYCDDDVDGQGFVFGSTGTLRALLGKEIPKAASTGCCSPASKDSVCNAMNEETDIQALCENLGYTRGTLLEKGPANKCPQVRFDKKEGRWTSSFSAAGGPGKKFRCQGPTSKDLYTQKAYYKGSEPKKGKGRSWDLVMEFQDGAYKFHSLSIEGVSYDGYKGSVTKCPVDARRDRIYGSYGFTPRITTLGGRSRVWIKDFRVFQGDDLSRPLRQIVGVGMGSRGKARQRLKEELVKRKAISAHLRKLRRAAKREKSDPGLRNDMRKVADWVDKESLCKSEMPKSLWGACAKTRSNRVGIWIKYASGLEGFAAYDGVAGLWGKGSFKKKLKASISTGFFSKCSGLRFLGGEGCRSGKGLAMAWGRCRNKFSGNFALDYNPKKCSDTRASKKGWAGARIRLYCKM